MDHIGHICCIITCQIHIHRHCTDRRPCVDVSRGIGVAARWQARLWMLLAFGLDVLSDPIFSRSAFHFDGD